MQEEYSFPDFEAHDLSLIKQELISINVLKSWLYFIFQIYFYNFLAFTGHDLKYF